jgi:hypothetical protein
MASAKPSIVEEESKITIEEKIELTLNGDCISSAVLSKKSQHGQTSVANEFEFDLSQLDNKAFEKALLSNLKINNIFDCSVLDASVKIRSKTITVVFESGLDR